MFLSVSLPELGPDLVEGQTTGDNKPSSLRRYEVRCSRLRDIQLKKWILF
jgi:hypothetical protein